MQFRTLATGSSGNCYLLQHGTDALMLDAGIRYKAIAEALAAGNISRVDAALITHEHGDHSVAMSSLLRHGWPVYASRGTVEALIQPMSPLYYLPIIARAGELFKVGRWQVLPVAAEHDAAEPLGFLIRHQTEENKILYLTDSFYCRNTFQGLTQVVVECNYILDVLRYNVDNGLIPKLVRDRLLTSHFELGRLIEFLRASDLKSCRQIILVHLSDGNSDERRMIDAVTAATGVPCIAANAGLQLDFGLVPF